MGTQEEMRQLAVWALSCGPRQEAQPPSVVLDQAPRRVESGQEATGSARGQRRDAGGSLVSDDDQDLWRRV